MIVLSDHGQSFGATFKQRYDVSLKEFIEQHLPTGVTVSQMIGGDTGVTSLTAVGAELENLEEADGHNAVSRGIARQGTKLIDRGTKERREIEGADGAAAQGAEKPQVVAYGSGNLAQVYFDLFPRKITLNELNAAYPGMVFALVEHPGIGLVCGYDDDGTPVCLGKEGTRNLHTGEVTGTDPLKMLRPGGPFSVRAQLHRDARLAGAPRDGLPPRRRPDGDQHGLPRRHGRGAGGADRQPRRHGRRADRRVPVPPGDDGRSRPAQLGGGIRGAGCPPRPPDHRRRARGGGRTPDAKGRRVVGGEPLGRDQGSGGLGSASAAGLDPRPVGLPRSGEQPADDRPGPSCWASCSPCCRRASSPASLRQVAFGVLSVLVAWLVTPLVVYIVGRVLSRQGYYTRTMRTLGFARVLAVISLLAVIPQARGVVLVLYLLVEFLALWMAGSEAHVLGGWRGLLLPVLALALAAIIPLLLVVLLTSAAAGIDAIMQQLGLVGAA